MSELRNQARGIKRIFVYVLSFASLFLLVGCSSEKYSKTPIFGISVSYCPECGDASAQCRCESSFILNRVTTEPLIIGIDKEDGDLWVGWEEDMVDKKKIVNEPDQPVFPRTSSPYAIGVAPDGYKEGKRHAIGRVVREVGKNGKSTLWYGDGQKKLEKNYRDGNRDGKWTLWHQNGQKWSEVNYKLGKKVGTSIEWYENGQKSSEGNFKDGKEHGKWTSWDENGQIKSEENYKDGALVD